MLSHKALMVPLSPSGPLFFFFFSFSLFFGLSLPARTAPPLDKTTATTVDALSHQFQRLVDAERGKDVAGIAELKRYLNRFGYVVTPEATNFSDSFDDRFSAAVSKYQSNLGLTVTGRLDSDTISSMTTPRCGVSDAPSAGPVLRSTRRYQFFPGQPRWTRSSLTYAFSPANAAPYLDPSEVRNVFRRAFSRWAAVIPVTFEETPDYLSADVKIGFYGGDHGDGEPFDGVLGVLAHAFSPENGRFHLDAAETWSLDFGSERSRSAVDLESVATHEIGHVLGLAHTPVREAIMYASLSPRTKKVDLTVDDVKGAQFLYGSNPDFNISSLAASDTSSASLCTAAVGRIIIVSLAAVAMLLVSSAAAAA
ncbi:hypothetical protein H6P81_005189 [Aristolochia fimbriata]|uniref:Peptidase metallopeptidase domain-containing protein n=1 Tax=Aristolochia fimbriata TaxID=158543 RepID=A0AAV7ETS1_ARIFI|nr:hypothetical protein H6P81_005189 [Aristolochia fimbriata]